MCTIIFLPETLNKSAEEVAAMFDEEIPEENPPTTSREEEYEPIR